MQTSEFRVMRSFDIHYFILVVPDEGFLGRENPGKTSNVRYRNGCQK